MHKQKFLWSSPEVGRYKDISSKVNIHPISRYVLVANLVGLALFFLLCTLLQETHRRRQTVRQPPKEHYLGVCHLLGKSHFPTCLTDAARHRQVTSKLPHKGSIPTYSERERERKKRMYRQQYESKVRD